MMPQRDRFLFVHLHPLAAVMTRGLPIRLIQVPRSARAPVACDVAHLRRSPGATRSFDGTGGVRLEVGASLAGVSPPGRGSTALLRVHARTTR
jgi:hypothetical protein